MRIGRIEIRRLPKKPDPRYAVKVDAMMTGGRWEADYLRKGDVYTYYLTAPWGDQRECVKVTAL
jgi:hypothetical protein